MTEITTRPTTDEPAGAVDRTEDVEAIHRIVQNVERSFNTNDVDGLVADLAADAAVTNARGVRVVGFDALLESTRVGFAGFLKDEHARYEVDDVRFLGGDVALADKRAWATDADGELLDLEPAMRVLYVLKRVHGRWWVAARSHSLIA
jgi:uncharacterized protein (TIGR02246 family)